MILKIREEDNLWLYHEGYIYHVMNFFRDYTMKDLDKFLNDLPDLKVLDNYKYHHVKDIFTSLFDIYYKLLEFPVLLYSSRIDEIVDEEYKFLLFNDSSIEDRYFLLIIEKSGNEYIVKEYSFCKVCEQYLGMKELN